MGPREKVRTINQPSVQLYPTRQSMLLVSSGAVRRCKQKESIMVRIKKRIVKWRLSASDR